MMHIAETEEQAREEARWGLQGWVRYMLGILPLAQTDPDDFDGLVDELNQSIFVIGTPEMARKRIEKILDLSGGVGSFVVGNTEIADPQAQRDSYELLAREVFPYFTGQVGPRLTGVESMAKFGKSGERLAAAHEKARQEYAAEQAADRAAQR
jgi:limonene 1,2-monooxygenase